MTREEVYKKCIYEEPTVRPGITLTKVIFPLDVIDAIIDCAVEEAIKKIKGEE